MELNKLLKNSLTRYVKQYYNHIFFCKPIIFYLRIKNTSCYISNCISLNLGNRKNIFIGVNSIISDFVTIHVISDPKGYGNEPKLSIGNNTYIGEYNNIRAGGESIIIGNNCLLSQHITLVSSNHKIAKNELIREQGWKCSPIVIEDDVWIGANSVILPGITIGKGAVVGAGSIVTNDVPSYAIVVGNPARIIKFRK